VPATKYEASLLRIASATMLTARSSASSSARCTEALLRAGGIVVDVRRGGVFQHDLVGGDFNELLQGCRAPLAIRFSEPYTWACHDPPRRASEQYETHPGECEAMAIARARP
jgi:hypothetical protein